MRAYEQERPKHEPAEAELQEPNPAICAWCGNKNQEGCVERCQAERQYCYLEPATLHEWELPPELPPFRVLAHPAPPSRPLSAWRSSTCPPPTCSDKRSEADERVTAPSPLGCRWGCEGAIGSITGCLGAMMRLRSQATR